MRRRESAQRVLVLAMLVGVGAVGCAGLGNRVDGTLIEVIDTGVGDTAAIVVELDEGELAGSTDVVVNFSLDVLRCIEGGEATTEDLRPGVDVRAQRFDSDEIDTATLQPSAARTWRSSATDDPIARVPAGRARRRLLHRSVL